MESLMSIFANQPNSYMTKLGSTTDHSCYRFIVPEELRPQELSHASDERGDSPPHIAVKYPRYLPSVPSSTEGSVETTSPFTPSSTPSPASSPSSYHYDTNIKRQETAPPVVYDPHSHRFSIESLVGDITDKKEDPSRPAEVFRSTYLDDEINRYIMWQSYLTRFYSQSGNNSPPKVTDHKVSQHTTETNVAYWCHVCNALCMDTSDVARHRYVHITKGDKCRLRSSLFRDHGCVTAHTRLDGDRLQCGLCDKVVTQCYFSKHQGIHEGHFCDECCKEFSTNSRLRDHMNVHNGKTPFTCTICDRSFAKRSSWTQHQRYHRDHRSFECQFCKKRFNSKYACVVHERLHTGENPYQCEFPGCNRSYPQKIQLKLHTNTHK